MLPAPIQDAISKVSPEAQEMLKLIVSYYEGEVEKLKTEIKELKDESSKTS